MLNDTPTLYIVGAPIGNLQDLSPRAGRVLRRVSVIAAEDTRVARRLLQSLPEAAPVGARVRLVSFHVHNWRERLGELLEGLESGDVALVCDAGMPGISDPGRELVAAAAGRGVRIESVPGPSAVTAALSVSGMAADAFQFLGFLPRRRRERQGALRRAAVAPITTVLFEAPHRLRPALHDIALIFGARPIAVCRELTKWHEEVFRGTAQEALEHFDAPRGEFTLVIAGAAAQLPGQPGGGESGGQPMDGGSDDDADDDNRIRRFLLERRAAGVRARDAVSQAATLLDAPRNRVYRIWLEIQNDPGGNGPDSG